MLIGSLAAAVSAVYEDEGASEINNNTLKPVGRTIDDLAEPQLEQVRTGSSKIDAQKVYENMNANYDPDSPVQPRLKIIEMPISFPEPQIEQENGYTTLNMPDFSISGAPGEPELLTKTINFKFEPGTTFTEISFVPENLKTVTLTQQLIPIQPPMPLSLLYQYSLDPPELTSPDPSIYLTPAQFPSAWFEHNTGMGIDLDTDDTKLFLNVKLYPTRYQPVNNEITYATSGTLTVKYTPPTKTELNKLVYSSTGPINENYKLLIITPNDNEFIENLTRLATFKTGTDMPAKVVNIDEINNGTYFGALGRDQQEKIKTFIYNARKTWNISYVILAGDAQHVPHRNVYITGSMAGNVPSDMYYADVFDDQMDFCDWDGDNDNIFGEYASDEIDGTDKYPDVYIGRLPADSGAHIELLVDKIINYESTVSGQPWFDNITMSGTNTFAGTSVPEGEFSCENIYDKYMQDFIPTKIYETTTYERDLPCTTSNIVNTLNAGSGFATFHDHGAPSSWAGKFSSTNAKNLNNGDKLPFLNFDACSTGRFDDQDSITEHVVLNPNGGSIISIGASRIGWGAWGPSHIESNSGYFNTHLYEMYNNGEGTAGRIFTGSKISYLDNVGISGYYDYMTLTEYILFGDPSLSVGGIPLKDINITCEENTSFVAPSNSVKYDVTIINEGTLSRPIKLNVGGVPENWTAVLNESLLLVPGNSSQFVSLTVTAADNALYQDVADIEVFAFYSKNKERTISIMTHTFTTRIYGVDINTTLLEATIYPGENVTYWFEVSNLGNALDAINLTAELMEPLPDWKFEFEKSDPIINPYEYEIIKMKVTAPSKTHFDMYEIQVTGKLPGPQVEDNIVIRTNISRTYGIDMVVDENKTMKFDPGENFTYHMDIFNLGNYLDKVKFSIQRAPKTWEILLNRPKAFKVDAFSTKKAELFFEIPEQTEVGMYLIRLRAHLISNDTNWIEADFEVIVNRVYEYKVSVEETDVNANPGETKEFEVILSHLGNGDDVIELSLLNKPRDWIVNFTTKSKAVEPFENYTVMVQVTPSVKAITNKYPFQLKVILLGSQEIKELGLNITVNPIDGYELICIKNRYQILPGDTQQYWLTVNNLGNHDDEIELNITNVPGLWEADFDTIEATSHIIKLEPFNSITQKVKIDTDSKAIAGEYWICVNGKLQSTGEEIKVYLYLIISPFYGVTLDSENKLIRTHPGEDFEITLNITNDGNIKDDINRKLTGLPQGWVVYAPIDYTYSQLGPYETKKEIIRVSVPEDETNLDVNLTIKISSETEPKEGDEKRSFVYVETKPKSEPEQTYDFSDLQGLTFYIIVPIIILIIVFVVITFLIIKTRKEHKEDMEVINELRRHEDKEMYGEGETSQDIYGQAGDSTYSPHGHSAPGTPPSTLQTHKRSVRTRRMKTHRPKQPRSVARSGSRPRPKHESIGKGGAEKVNWIDKPPMPPIPGTQKRRVRDEEVQHEEDFTKIECPKCGKRVGIDEYKCPYCGELFEDFDDEVKGKDELDVHLPGDDEPGEIEFEEEELDEEWEDADSDDVEEEPDVEFEEDDVEEFELEEEEADFEEVDTKVEDDELEWEMEE
jgi:uncharacterized membrane protein